MKGALKLDTGHWVAAVALSMAFHLTVASVMHSGDEPILIAGGGSGSVMLIGNSATDSVASGGSGTPEEVETSPEAPESKVTPLASPQVSNATALEPAETKSVEAVAIAPVQTETVDARYQIDDVAAEVAPQAAPVVNKETIEAKAVEPVVGGKKAAPHKTTSKPRTDSKVGAVRKKNISTKGVGGAATVDAQKGSSVQSSSTSGSEEGNAAISNYPGIIASRLRRALRYPKSALRGAGSGQVQIAFTVMANGQAVSVSIVKSSGSTILDQAAMDAVRRASPFPPFPSGSGRSRWPFAIPIFFKR